MRLQYSSPSSTSVAPPCLLPGAGFAGGGGGGSCCWGCCYGALLFFLWTSAAVTASSSSSSSASSAGGADAGGAGAGGSAAAAASPHSPAPPLAAAVVAGGALLAAVAAGGAGLCYSSPTVGSVQELAQRARVVLEGKVQGKRKAPADGKPLTHTGEGEQQPVSSAAPRLEPVTDSTWTAASAANLVTATAALDWASPAATPSSPPAQSYLVRVHQLWPVKSGGLQKDSLITVHGDFSSSCLGLKEDSRYIFFMEPTNSSSVFWATFPPLETGRNLKKDVGRVLCRGCGDGVQKRLASRVGL